jgi:uncharacterized membrane protein YczE
MDKKVFLVKKQRILRFLIYLIGVNCMALGTTLNAKTGLGLGTITSLPNAASLWLGMRLSTAVLILYCLMILAQFWMKGRNRSWWDLLQLPTSFLFSAYLELFDRLPLDFPHLWQNLLMMAAASCITGVGVSITVNMDIAPNPPDGLVYTASNILGRDMGLVKNVLDAVCVLGAVSIDLLCCGQLRSVGIGTVWAMIFIGRTVSVFNRLFKKKIRRLVGLQA